MTFLKDAWQALAKRLNGLRRPPPAPQVLRIKSKGKVQRPAAAADGQQGKLKSQLERQHELVTALLERHKALQSAQRSPADDREARQLAVLQALLEEAKRRPTEAVPGPPSLGVEESPAPSTAAGAGPDGLAGTNPASPEAPKG